MRRWLLALVVLIAGCAASGPAGRSEHTLLVSDAATARLGVWASGDDPSLAAARAAFGKESSCEPVNGFAGVEWKGLGVRAEFGSYGGLADRPICDQGSEIVLSSASFTGWQWQTARGLRVGDSAARLHQLYPQARRGRGSRDDAPVLGPHPDGVGWTLVPWPEDQLVDFWSPPNLSARVEGGEVTALVVGLGYEGE